MATFLIVRGMEDIELAENFNMVRSRINQALTGTNNKAEKADDKTRVRPLNKLTFKTILRDEDDEDEYTIGRIAIAPEHVIGVGSDEEKDGNSDDEEEDDD